MIIPKESLAIFKSYSNIKSIVPVIAPAGQLRFRNIPPQCNASNGTWIISGPLTLPTKGHGPYPA